MFCASELSFEASVLQAFSREGLQAALRYADVAYSIDISPEWQVQINPFSPFRVEDGGMTVERYEQGRIGLTIVQDITHVYGRRRTDPRCSPPEDASMPDGCEVRWQAARSQDRTRSAVDDARRIHHGQECLEHKRQGHPRVKPDFICTLRGPTQIGFCSEH